MLTLWGRPNSSNVKKTLWMLEELGLTYTNIKVGGSYGGLGAPSYLAMNPNGLIPTLQDGELVLWESNTIMRYLAARYGQGSLWIDDAGERASTEKWMDWASSRLFAPFHDLLFHAVRLPEPQRDGAIRTRAVENFEKALAVLDQELAGNPWLSGKKFGIGDIPAATFIYYYYAIDVEKGNSFPHVEAWYQRLGTRPAYVDKVMTPIT